MSNLASLNLEHVYDSSEYNLVDQLISPLLSKSINYYRGVGYFSSGWLKVASQGLSKFINNGGHAKIILSPILDDKDWETIKLGQKAKEDKWLKKSLAVSLDEIEIALESETLNTFAWMIADDLIELRFAVPREGFESGDYHDKVAVFEDLHNNIVAIHGSYNDSIKGSLNGEAFSVFRSWDAGQKPFVEKHQKRLIDLWEDKNSQFFSFQIPTAIKERIIKLRTTNSRPYNLKDIKLLESISPKIPENVNLYDYQNEAIEEWLKKGCSGIFEMATGSGKTYTSLSAYVRQYERIGKLALIILVPYLHLLFQWEKDCEKFGLVPVLCGSSISNWKIMLKTAISDFRLSKKSLCIIAVHQTGGSDAFIKNISKIPKDNLMLIADEVHGLGARKLSAALIDDYSARIGLSATPNRWYDDQGTKILHEYFDGVCFSFTLKDAIEKKFLVPYKYYPILIHLSPDEEYKIESLSKTITRLFNKKKDSISHVEEKILEQALRDRANVVKKAENKLSTLKELISKQKAEKIDFMYSIFYSPESQHSNVLNILKKHHIFASQFIGEDSYIRRQAVIKDFESGKITALVAMKCLDEGVDVPSTKTAYFISSTTNPKEFIQRRGRVLRKSNRKNVSIIFDFIVVPTENSAKNVSKYILEREMPRFAEFSDLALNGFNARSIIRPILDYHEMLHLIDKKPWDVYKEQEYKFDEYNEE